MLKNKIKNQEKGILLYGLTPPKVNNTEERIREIAAKQLQRIQALDIDGLVLYDIQDEKDRTDKERPFPFLQTVDSYTYSRKYLKDLDLPMITYKCAGKYTPADMKSWLEQTRAHESFAVFVGIATDDQQVRTSLPEAYKLKADTNPNLMLGGVTIPERHGILKDEHLRVFGKQQSGCEFFVSQAVYNVQASKDFLSDYYYHGQQHGLKYAPIIFTLTPCGSLKTLQFMDWLGISVPRWLENDLQHSHDILQKSVETCKNIAAELIDFATEKQIPIGFNIESVAIRREEIEASEQLTHQVGKLLGR
ncbi:MAG: hypothetical protein RIS47_1529 [Bacteroidota bacterium]|jgi:5,10-methylenetetrahydrofolate reductase